ncbi:MAG: hypothetical protein AAF772_19260, partial [Acidobacteriota bacterium]
MTTRLPTPIRRGDQGRVCGWGRTLGGRHRLDVLAQDLRLLPRTAGRAATPPADGLVLQPLATGWRDLLQVLPGAWRRPLQVALYGAPRVQRAVRDAIAAAAASHDGPYDAVVGTLARTGDLRAAVGPTMPLVIDLIDALTLNMARRAARGGGLA